MTLLPILPYFQDTDSVEMLFPMLQKYMSNI